MLADIAFSASAGFIVYTYAGYPLLMHALAQRRTEPPCPMLADDACPSVTAVIAVHNESHRIAAKVANLRAMDYPQDKLRILFVSDGSSDNTADTIRRFDDVDLLAYAHQRGKAHAINTAMREVDTPVVLLCDARQEAEPQALRAVVSRLMQPGVGAVSGELVHRDPLTPTATQIGAYWRYEKWIRRSESLVASVVGATGAFYVIRREGFIPIAPDTLLDDFEIPMQIARQGMRVKFEPQAIVYDELQKDMAGEHKRKLRTLSGNFQSFSRHPWLFNPGQNPVWAQFLSHKVFRLVAPYAMIVALLASSLGGSPWLIAAAALQWLFYIAAAATRAFPALARFKPFSLAHVFVDMNLAALEASLRYAFGRSFATWEKT